jgi:hypothetical protein
MGETTTSPEFSGRCGGSPADQVHLTLMQLQSPIALLNFGNGIP